MKDNRTREVVTMLIIGVVLFLTMLLTYSRGIWIGFAAMILYWAIFVERRLFLSLLVVPLILCFYEGKLLRDFGLYSKVMIRHQIFAGLYGIAQCISYEKIQSLVLGGIHST